MASGINVIFSITDLASSTLANVRSQMDSVANGITEASTALFFWESSFKKISAVSTQFYDLFIGQNERMRQAILATQASLAAVQDVYINGVKELDPAKAIQAFDEPIRKSLNQIAVESLGLVGVTSSQLTDLFQIALTSATKITNQSKDFADPIKAAERLTLSFAGAFGAMQIPLYQARQEMTSIVTGTIDMNSRLAKGLSLTNEQVRLWSSQGVLVDKIIGKLQPFIAGNALAAHSIGGITSNLYEILQITTRLAGENITSLFIDGLDVIYKYLQNVQPQIQETLNNVISFITNSVNGIVKIIEPFLPSLTILRDAILSIGGSIGEIIGGSIQTLLGILAIIAPIISPIFDLLVSIVKVVAGLLSDPVIQQMVQMALIITTVIGPLTTIATLAVTISGLFAAGASLPLFLTTLAIVAPGLVASLTTLGTALLSIAGFGGAAGALAVSGSMMTVLGGAITSVAIALGPLALAIAAVAAAAYLFQNLKAGDATKAIDMIGARSGVTASGANDTTQKLRQLRDTEITQGELTDKQKADKGKLTNQARNYVADLEAEIAAAKEIDTAGNESLENAKKELIADNERSLKGLGKFTSGLTTSAKPLTELGGTITQLKNQVVAFEKQIKDANTDAEFNTAAKGISGLINQQVELGVITTEQGKKRLQLILNDSHVELAGREAAHKAIEQIEQSASKKELDRNQATQSEVETLQNQGKIGEVKAEQLLTEEKLKAIKIRTNAQTIAHVERMRQIQVEMNAELGKTDKEVADKQTVLDKLKASKAPVVQVVQAQRDLDTTKTRRNNTQLEFGAAQVEESRQNSVEVAKTNIESSKLEKQQRDVSNREALKDFDERQKINDSARDQGLKDNQQAATESLAIAESRAKAELSQIQSKTAKLEAEAKKQGKTAKEYDKEAWEALQVQQAEALQKLANARKDGFEKRLSSIKQDAQEATVIVEAAQAKNDIDNQQAAIKTAAIATKSINSQIILIDKEIAANKGHKERLEELNAKRAGLEKDLTEVQKKQLQQRLSDLQQDADERVAVVKAKNATGAIDNQQAAIQTAAIESASSKSQLQIIQSRIAEVVAADTKRGKVSIELLEELRKQEADTQVKITEIAKKEMESRLADLKEDVAERTAVVKSSQATGAIDNQAAATQTATIERTGAAQRLEIVRQRIQQVTASGKVNIELMESLKKQEAEIQIEVTEIDKKEMDSRLSDLQQDAEERIAIVQKANALGAKDNQQAAIETSQIQQKSTNEQIKIVQERIATVIEAGKKSGKANTELLEELRKKEADLQVKITEIQKQELQKRLSSLQQDSQGRVAIVEASAAMGIKDNQQAATEIENIQRQSVNDQLKLVRARIAAISPLNKELNEELRAQEAKLQKELTEIQEQSFQKRLSDLQQDGEERLAIVTANSAKGITDNQETALKSAAIQEESAQQQLALIRDRLARTNLTSIELREKLLKQEADTEAKIIEIRKQAFDKRLADLEQDSQEQQTILEGQLAQGLTTEAEYAQSRYDQSLQFLDAQLVLIRERRSQISATDIEGQEALAAQEATMQKRRQDALSQFLEAQLSLLDRENKKATDILEQSEVDRRLITKQAALSGATDKDAAATAEIQATQHLIQQEIALEEQKNVTLRSLPAFSDPAKEAERQSRIRASIKKTSELRLQLLDEEKKAFDLLIERQIKGIQNQSRAQELASDVQVRAIEQQGKQYDLLGRSLENQNKLLQSRASLANALNGYIQGEYKILQDSATSEGERKRLMKEAADAQLIAMQQQQIVAQKNLDIEIKQAEIAQKRAEFEAEIAEIKARAGSAKADAEVLKAEATLQKVQRDPNASNADVVAAKLDIVAARASAEAAVAEIAFAIANKELVGQNRGVLDIQNANKRETQSIEQVTQGRAAQSQAIGAIVDPNERDLAQRQLAGRLTPEESAQLGRIQQQNREREVTRQQNEAERDALRGGVSNSVQRNIQAAAVRSGSLLGTIEQTAATPPKVPDLKNLIAQMTLQRQQISVKPDVNPLIQLQEESTGYQKEMLGVLQQINKRPMPVPVTPVENNFNIKAEAGISEAQVLGVFGQVSQQVSQMLKR